MIHNNTSGLLGPLIPESARKYLRHHIRSIQEAAMDFQASFLYLIQNGLAIREDSQLELNPGTIEAVQELIRLNALEISNYFSACQDKVIDKLGQIFTGTKGIKSLDQSKRYGLSPAKGSANELSPLVKDKENLTKEELKEEQLKKSRKKQCLRKFKQIVDILGTWKTKAAEFDGLFYAYDGIRRNFEQQNQYLAGSLQNIDLQKWLILPLVSSQDPNSQFRLAQLVETKTLELRELRTYPRQQRNSSAIPTSYFQHIVPVSANDVTSLKQQMRVLDSQYSSYQSNYEHLKPVFNFYLEESQQNVSKLVKQGESELQSDSNRSLDSRKVNRLSSSSDVLVTERHQDINQVARDPVQPTSILKVPNVVRFKETQPEQAPITSEELNFEPSDRRPYDDKSQQKFNPLLVSQIQVKPESSERQQGLIDLEKTAPIIRDQQKAFISDIDNRPTPNPKVSKFVEFTEHLKEQDEAQKMDGKLYLPEELRSPEDSPLPPVNTDKSEDDPESPAEAKFSSRYSFDSQFNTKRNEQDGFQIKVSETDQTQNAQLETNFGRYEIPIYTVVCQPSPRPILQDAFFMNQMQLPEPNVNGHLMNPLLQSHYNSENSKIVPGELSMRNSLINFDSNSESQVQNCDGIKLISLSPSNRTPMTEGVYSTNSALFYVGIVKHYELRSPETRIKIKQLASGLDIIDLVYFGYSEISFVFDQLQKAILAVDLKGNQQKILQLEDSLDQGSILRRVISPTVGLAFAQKKYYGEKFLSPQRNTKFSNLKEGSQNYGHEMLLKEALLVKSSNQRLELIYGFDATLRQDLDSANKPGWNLKQKAYFVESMASTSMDDQNDGLPYSDRADAPKEELRVYVLALSGWLGIYSVSVGENGTLESICIKEIELETGNKVQARRLRISEPQLIGDWETEAGYSPYKNLDDGEFAFAHNLIHERWSRIIAIQFESKPGSSKFKQSIFFFRLLPETYSFSLLFHYKLSSSSDLKLDQIDENSPKKRINSEKLINNKITNMNLNFDGFFLLSFKTHLEVFSLRHEKGKVKMKKETQYVGQEGQFQSSTFCPFEREDDQGRIWWVSRLGLLSSLEEGWGMREWKETQQIRNFQEGKRCGDIQNFLINLFVIDQALVGSGQVFFDEIVACFVKPLVQTYLKTLKNVEESQFLQNKLIGLACAFNSVYTLAIRKIHVLS